MCAEYHACGNTAQVNGHGMTAELFCCTHEVTEQINTHHVDLMRMHSLPRISGATHEERMQNTLHEGNGDCIAHNSALSLSAILYLLTAIWAVQGVETPLVQKKLALLQGEGLSFNAAGKLTSAPAAVMGVDDFS